MRVKFYLACIVGALMVDNTDAAVIHASWSLFGSSDKKKKAEATTTKKEPEKKKEKTDRTGSLSSVSHSIAESLTGKSPFTLIAQEYSDYCSFFDPLEEAKPLSFLDFIYNTRFVHYKGDFFSFKTIKVDYMGEDESGIDVQNYMKAREDSRGKAFTEKGLEIENMAIKLVEETLANKKKPTWADAITPWTAELIVLNKDNTNPQVEKSSTSAVVPKATQIPIDSKTVEAMKGLVSKSIEEGKEKAGETDSKPKESGLSKLSGAMKGIVGKSVKDVQNKKKEDASDKKPKESGLGKESGAMKGITGKSVRNVQNKKLEDAQKKVAVKTKKT